MKNHQDQIDRQSPTAVGLLQVENKYCSQFSLALIDSANIILDSVCSTAVLLYSLQLLYIASIGSYLLRRANVHYTCIEVRLILSPICCRGFAHRTPTQKNGLRVSLYYRGHVGDVTFRKPQQNSIIAQYVLWLSGIYLIAEIRRASSSKTLKLTIQMETHTGEVLQANYSQFRVEQDQGRYTLVVVCKHWTNHQQSQ